MEITLLFQCPEGYSMILSEEWLASAVSIASAFIIFILGVPILTFETISEPLRHIYFKRLGKQLTRLIFQQIILVLVLFILSHGAFVQLSCSKPYVGWGISFIVFLTTIYMLYVGYWLLIDSLNASRNFEQRLSQKIADDAITWFGQYKKLHEKDIEELGTLARELPAGRKKNIYLVECERLLDHLLNLPPLQRDPKMISDILEKTVCLAVTYDGAKFNNENMWKVLDILHFAHSQTHSDGAPDASSSYLNTFIGISIKEIGIIAMQKGDLRSVMRAVEKIFVIESTSRELFALGAEALRLGHIETVVTVMRKLGSDVQRDLTQKKDDKRAFNSWLGLMSKMYLSKGSAGEFARRQMDNIIQQSRKSKEEMPHLFKDAQAYFYNLADFATIDALRKVQEEFQK